jgi:hypothetical protein
MRAIRASSTTKVTTASNLPASWIRAATAPLSSSVATFAPGATCAKRDSHFDPCCFVPPELPTLERATLWQEGAAVDLTALISDDDPLKGFVVLEFAFKITDSGVILVIGRDLRDGFERSYLLTPTGVSSPASSPPPSSSDTDSGGGAVDLLSLLLLGFGLLSRIRAACPHFSHCTLRMFLPAMPQISLPRPRSCPSRGACTQTPV